MSLRDWQAQKHLAKHQTSPREIADLLALAERDLEACRTPGLHPDWQIAIAHNAVVQLATAALAAAGYRPRGAGQHYYAIQSLAFTVGLEPELVQELDYLRRKRNQSAYEHAGLASTAEAEEMVALASQLRDRVRAWLQEEHPELLEK